MIDNPSIPPITTEDDLEDALDLVGAVLTPSIELEAFDEV